MIVVKSTSHPFIGPFLRDHDPQAHLPTANYILDVSGFSSDGSSPTGIRSGEDQGAKAPEAFCGGKGVFLLGVGVCLFYAMYIPYISTER